MQSSLLLIEKWWAPASLPRLQKRFWKAGGSYPSFLQSMCAKWPWSGWFCVIRIFPHHLLLVRGAGPLPEEIAFPQVWQLSLCFPSHQSGWHFTGKMLFNSTTVLGWYIQCILGHCFLLVRCSLKIKILSSNCSSKLLLLLDKVSEEWMDYTYSRNFNIRHTLFLKRDYSNDSVEFSTLKLLLTWQSK